jgi:hypothetical protein
MFFLFAPLLVFFNLQHSLLLDSLPILQVSTSCFLNLMIYHLILKFNWSIFCFTLTVFFLCFITIFWVNFSFWQRYWQVIYCFATLKFSIDFFVIWLCFPRTVFLVKQVCFDFFIQLPFLLIQAGLWYHDFLPLFPLSFHLNFILINFQLTIKFFDFKFFPNLNYYSNNLRLFPWVLFRFIVFAPIILDFFSRVQVLFGADFHYCLITS